MIKRPLLRYHGGKWMLAPWIIDHFPSHRIYVEPFVGAGSVFMRKRPAPFLEVLNDTDQEIVNLYRVLRDPLQADRLKISLELTPYSRVEFALSYHPTDDPIEQARRTVVRAFQGFGSDSASGAPTGFRANGNRNNGHPAHDWTNYPPALADFVNRLRGVVIENRPATEIIQQQDSPETLFYCDPPYTHGARSKNTTRNRRGGYRHEMTDDDHRALAEVLQGVAGMVLISGYHSDLYQQLYSGWHQRECRALADHSLIRTEVLWINDAAWNKIESERLPLLEATL